MLNGDDLDLNLFRRILRHNLNVQNEKVLIVGDAGINGSQVSQILTEQYRAAAQEEGFDYRVYVKPVVPMGGQDEELGRVIKKLPDASTLIVNVSNKIGRMDEMLSFRKYCRAHQHKFASSSNLAAIQDSNIQAVLKAYQAPYKKIAQRGQKLKAMLDGAEVVEITSQNGTDLWLEVKGMQSVINSGVYRNPGEGGNFPGGEVYIPPRLHGVEGTIVIDGSYRYRGGSALVEEPITVTVQNSNVLHVEGGAEASALKQTLQWAWERAKNPRTTLKIGELGIGINDHANLIGCTVVDEKTTGTCHVAIGSNAWFGGPIKARIHLDQVLRRPKMYIDGKKVSIQEDA